jgi:peptidoglycan L-alanyl-D-glutamate endopeptidase CwlK
MTTQADRIAAALRPIAPNGQFLPNEVPLLNQLGSLWEGRLAAAAPPMASTPATGKFVLGGRSLERLETVKPELARTVKLAITFSAQDFAVNQGLRSLAEQRKAVAAGNSRTMHSKHLPQPDGKAWAVDLVAWVNGSVSWEFDLYGEIAHAMDLAATQLGFAHNIRWGCAWDRVLADFGGDRTAYLAEASAYAKRHAGSDLLDAPHFEWVT